MLEGRLARRGYDWWWHALWATERATGRVQPFFIQYFVINPALGGERPVFGQLPANRARGVRPSYAMLKAGTLQPGGSVQIHNHYGIADVTMVSAPLRVQISPHELTDRQLQAHG